MPDTPIKDSLDQLMKDIPATGRGFSEIQVTQSGWKTELGHKISDGWAVSAFSQSKWKMKPDFGVLVKGKW